MIVNFPSKSVAVVNVLTSVFEPVSHGYLLHAFVSATSAPGRI